MRKMILDERPLPDYHITAIIISETRNPVILSDRRERRISSFNQLTISLLQLAIRSLAEFTLSRKTRSFASLRMTTQGSG